MSSTGMSSTGMSSTGWKTSKGIRQLCGTVLAMEAVVIGLSIPVAIVLEHARHGLAGGVGGGLAVCALLLSGLVGRPATPWAIWAGTALQAIVIAAGVVVSAMYVLGVIFAALWVTGIWLARLHVNPGPSVNPSATEVTEVTEVTKVTEVAKVTAESPKPQRAQ
jgi:hypothetical protein